MVVVVVVVVSTVESVVIVFVILCVHDMVSQRIYNVSNYCLEMNSFANLIKTSSKVALEMPQSIMPISFAFVECSMVSKTLSSVISVLGSSYFSVPATEYVSLAVRHISLTNGAIMP